MNENKLAFAIPDFLKSFAISRATLYKLWKQDKGPQYFHIGRRRFISSDAAAQWVKKLEQETNLGSDNNENQTYNS